MVIKTAFILSAFFKQKTRPPNSPTLLGVNMDTVIPKNTAFSDTQKLTFSILEIRNFHLIASIDQLTNIKTKTNNKSK